MQYGEFVSYKDFRVWVEYEWLDYKCTTLLSKAKEIYHSGWMKLNKPFDGLK
jgi:hypothetical protein